MSESRVIPNEMTQQYASVNGLHLYYEIYGKDGRPLVLLHGGLMTIGDIGPLLPALAQTRRVIAVELEGHGHTADLDRPLQVEQMAEDIAGLIRQLGIGPCDLFGFSIGGMTAMGVAMRHAELVHKLVVVSAPYCNEGFYPAVVEGWKSMSPEGFAGSPMEHTYRQIAPKPDHWPVFLDKLTHALIEFKGWPAGEVASIQAPTLILLGDTDLVRPEHSLEMFRLLGGGSADGGMSGSFPNCQFAVLPKTTHFNILAQTELLVPIVVSFLDTPILKAK